MITPSHPWKQSLLRQAEVLQELRKPHRWGEASSARLEETVVLGCYAVRRLVCGFLLSDALVHRLMPMTAFPARRKSGLLLGDEPLQDLYDLQVGKAVAHDLLFLCHQVIQNCIFVPQFDEGHALQGIYVTSDHQHKVALYRINVDAVGALFTSIGSEH